MLDLKGILFFVFVILIFAVGLYLGISNLFIELNCKGYIVKEPVSRKNICIAKPEGK